MRLGGLTALVAFGCRLAFAAPPPEVDDEVDEVDEEGGEPVLPEISGDISQIDISKLLEMPIVESASRRRQSLHEAPASLTALRGDEIASSDPTSIASVLRRVPGVHVMQLNANLFSVGMRGVNRIGNKNVIVLFNGRRLSDIALGAPTWIGFPAHVAEIERIEVLRGPGTTLYGADALSGVINIRTARPLDHLGTEAIFGAGTTVLPNEPADFARQRLENMGNGYVAYDFANDRRTVGQRFGVGFAHTPDWTDGTGFSLRRYGDVGYHAAWSLDVRPSSGTSLFVDARHVFSEGANAVDTLTSQPIFLSMSEQSLSAQLERRLADGVTLKANADGRRIQVRTTVDMRNATGILVFEPENVGAHGLLQLDFASGSGRNVASVAGEVTAFHTFDWFEQSLDQRYFALVAQDELRVFDDPRILLSAAMRAEQIDSTSDSGEEVTYRNVNPRLSVVARVSPRHSLRVTAATAYRTPSPFENFLELASDAYYGDTAPPVPTLVPNPSLEPERAETLELGWRGQLLQWLRADAVAYAQRLHNPIALERPQLPFQYQNVEDQEHLGIEIGLSASAGDSAAGYLSYALTRAVLADSGERTEQFPKHLLAVGGTARLASTTLGVDFDFASHTTPTLLLPQQNGLALFTHAVPRQLILNLRAAHPVLDGKAEIFAFALNAIAMLRPRDDLRQFPNANTDPIGAIFLLGVRLRVP